MTPPPPQTSTLETTVGGGLSITLTYDGENVAVRVRSPGAQMTTREIRVPFEVTFAPRIVRTTDGTVFLSLDGSDARHLGIDTTMQPFGQGIGRADAMVPYYGGGGSVSQVRALPSGTSTLTVRVVSAIEQTRVPWCAIVIRRLFGLAGTAYARLQGINLHYAWPSARWGSIPFEGGIAAAYRRELDALPEEERATRLAELERKYERLASPFLTAEKFRVPDIIDPRETRPVLCDWIEDAYRVLPAQLGKKGRTMRR